MHTISYVIAVQSARPLYVVLFCTKVGSRHASRTEAKVQATLLHLAVCDGQCMTSRDASDLYRHTKKRLLENGIQWSITQTALSARNGALLNDKLICSEE